MNPSHSHHMDMETPNEQRNTLADEWLHPRGKIHKVPPLIRREDRIGGTYDPKVVSFGPYHHGKPELSTCEDMKLLALQTFVEGSNKKREFFQEKVLETIPYARSCYIDGSTEQYTDQQFAEMMLLDSCLLFYCISDRVIHAAPPGYYPTFYPGILTQASMYHDVFLLENQIPFKILIYLITLRYEDEGKNIVSEFLQQVAWDTFDDQLHRDIKEQLEDTRPLHLLEALHTVLAWDKNSNSTEEVTYAMTAEEYTDDKGKPNLLKFVKPFRSAKDLKAKGIHFRPSSTKSLKAIRFNSFIFHGELQLPTTEVARGSKIIFLNLIAYELRPEDVDDLPVMSYINFMKSLIVGPADVKELREKRILLSPLTDEDVVRFFKDLDTYEILSLEYSEANQRIQKHYDSKGKTWMAQLINTYFSSPWSFIGWFAGVVLLVLTVVQTYFTVNSKS